MAPRASYASDSEHPDEEIAALIKALHENGMELIMQFYFPNWITQVMMLDVVRYWVYTYHIDGVHLKGAIFNAVERRSAGYHSYGYYEYTSSTG